MNLLDGSLTFSQFNFCQSLRLYNSYERETLVLFNFISLKIPDSRFPKFIFITVDVCLQNTLCISYPYFREQNKQKTVVNINPPHGGRGRSFMNTSASNFVYCRIVVGCQQWGNNGPVLRLQNPFVNISHSICVEKRDLCIEQAQNLGNSFTISIMLELSPQIYSSV